MKKSLEDRYTPEIIKRADERRSKLDYKSLKVGENTTDRIDRILALLYETHQNYYFGHFNAACVLSGVLFEQAIICLLEEEIELKGSITIKPWNEIVKIDDVQELTNQSLLTLISAAKYLKIITSEHFSLVNELRHVRNYLMHDDLGRFMENKGNYEFTLLIKAGNDYVRTDISVPVDEINERCLTSESPEIWAYYILTRTRKIIGDMFKERVKRLPPGDF